MLRPIEVVSLLAEGRVSYDAALRLQAAAEERAKAGGLETLFLLEHEDVITIGRNAGRADLLASDEALGRLGVAVRASDRGGKLTYHGPGQLVTYPILNLAPDRTDVRRFMRDLEEALIQTAGDFGVAASRSSVPERWSSVWVGNEKLAAIGIHLSGWVTTHGAALNVTTNLARFSLIVPCGIADAGVTSIEKVISGSPAPSLPEVARSFVRHFTSIFERRPVPAGDEKREPLGVPEPIVIGKGDSE